MTPFLKYYFKKNPRYQTEVRPYKPRTREDFELAMSALIHPCQWTQWTLEQYNKEMEKRHYRSEAEAIEVELQIASIAIGSEERLKELEENPLKEDPDFLRWMPDRTERRKELEQQDFPFATDEDYKGI